RRIEGDIAAADAGYLRGRTLQNRFPIFPAVGCFEQAAIAAVRPKMTDCRDVSRLGICRMHDDARDRAAIFQSDVLPRATAIGGAVDTVAPARGISVVRLARPNPA